MHRHSPLPLALLAAALLGCGEGSPSATEPSPPAPPDPPPAVERPAYRVAPPAGKLPWPHHDPTWDQARYQAMLDSIWVLNNYGAYTGTPDRSALYLHD